MWESIDSKPKTDSIDDDGYNAGKIFVGGLHCGTTLDEFTENFASYGGIMDAVIMKDRLTGQPTFTDPAVFAKVIEDTHSFEGKQVNVEIKRTIPRRMEPTQTQSTEFETRKIFVGGIRSAVTKGS